MATLEREKEKQEATRAFNGELHGHFANSKAVSRGNDDDDDELEEKDEEEEEKEEEPARCLLLGESFRRKVAPVHSISQPKLPFVIVITPTSKHCTTPSQQDHRFI